MILVEHRGFLALHEAGATYAEIARECRFDWRTVKTYLDEVGVALAPALSTAARHRNA